MAEAIPHYLRVILNCGRMCGLRLSSGRLLVLLPWLLWVDPVEEGDRLPVVVDLRFSERVGKEFVEQDGALGPHSLQLQGTQPVPEPAECVVVDRS